MNKTSCWDLFFTFFKIGAFTFGGGYAMIPLIRREIVEGRQWMSDREMLDVVAIAESTPGPLAVNMATFVGRKTAGFLGALASTIGVVLPSFVLIILISCILIQIEDINFVKYAFNGIRAGVLVLIAQAFISLFKQSKKDWFAYGLMVVALILTLFCKIGTIPILLLCGAAGILRSMCRQRGKKQ